MTTLTTKPNPRREDLARLAYRISELADAIGVSRSAAYNLIRDGHLPSIKVSGVLLVLASDLEAFLQKCRG